MLPDGLGIATAAVLIGASFFTSAITGTFGIGGGLAMLALMGTVLPVVSLIPVHGLVQLGSNVGRTWHMRHALVLPMLLPFVAGAVLGALFGGYFVVNVPDHILKITLGLFIIAITWASLPKALGASRTILGAGGFVTTAMTMFLGATGPLVIALLAKTFDDRKQLVANTAASMSVQHFLKIAAFGLFGFAFAQWLPLVMAMVATGYLGTITGVKLLSQIDEQLFRKVFKIGLTLLALDLIRRGVRIG